MQNVFLKKVGLVGKNTHDWVYRCPVVLESRKDISDCCKNVQMHLTWTFIATSCINFHGLLISYYCTTLAVAAAIRRTLLLAACERDDTAAQKENEN